MTTDRDDIASLLERVKAATGGDAHLNQAIATAIDGYVLEKRGNDRKPWFYPAEGRKGITYRHDYFSIPRYTSSIDAALGLVERLLPGWMWRLASCSVSDDAWVCPDFNHPVHGAAFKAMFDNAYGGRDPAEVIIEATDVDRRPAGQPALALIEAMLLGLALLTPLKENHP